MALARGRLLSLDSYYESLRGNGGSAAEAEAMETDSSSVGYFGLITQNKAVEGDEVRDVDQHHHQHHPVAAESVLKYPLVNNPPPTVSDPSSSSTGSGGFVFGMMNSPSPVTIDSTGVGVGVAVGVGDHPHSNILNFKTGTAGGGATGCKYPSYLSSSMLSFDRHSQMEDYPVGFTDGLEQLDHFNFKYGGNGHHSSMRLANDQNFLETSSGNINGSTSVTGMTKDNERIGSDDQFGWIYASDTHTTDGDGHQESEFLDADVRKRPRQMAAGGGGGDGKASSKKHCSGGGGVSKKAKNKAAETKDPQSIAAKNRRERISEKLKILQELVPNGTKVDMVTMLEKAISYVKFLQLQVKVLATDEFWPTQGGKAPEVSQVKEAIDAILSSHSISTSK